MKPLKKIAAFVVAACLLGSCSGEVNPDPDFEVVDCPKVANPIQDLPWLANRVEEIGKQNYGIYLQLSVKILSGQYKGKIIYFIEYYRHVNGKLDSGDAYNCDGRNIAMFGIIPINGTSEKADAYYQALRANTQNLTVLFEKK
jgi:major membrane immunogen (membrane-anchored lipoprotein)